MSSILNSISSGDLQVQQAPEVKPVKEDSIIDLLQNSEIEFNTCPTLENNLDNVNTGFGENNDLYYDAPCTKPELKTPLYQENYLKEFNTEEEKAAARHALGLYNKGDIVAMSLLTAEDGLPTKNDWQDVTIKHLRKGDKFFAPVTMTRSVYNSEGVSLESTLSTLNSLIIKQQKDINTITQVSNSKVLTSLGDVTLFLQGFNNGDNLHNTLTTMDRDMLRFEKTGQM